VQAMGVDLRVFVESRPARCAWVPVIEARGLRALRNRREAPSACENDGLIQRIIRSTSDRFPAPSLGWREYAASRVK
jgi:hypothetical protein